MIMLIKGAAPTITEKVQQAVACKLTREAIQRIAQRAIKHGLEVQYHEDGTPYIDGHRADRWHELTSKPGSRGRDARFAGCFTGTSH